MDELMPVGAVVEIMLLTALLTSVATTFFWGWVLWDGVRAVADHLRQNPAGIEPLTTHLWLPMFGAKEDKKEPSPGLSRFQSIAADALVVMMVLLYGAGVVNHFGPRWVEVPWDGAPPITARDWSGIPLDPSNALMVKLGLSEATRAAANCVFFTFSLGMLAGHPVLRRAINAWRGRGRHVD